MTNSLEFDEEEFVEWDQSKEIQQLQRKLFVDNILGFLAKHPPNIQLWKFSLAVSTPMDHATDITTSINYAVSLGVEHLELDFSKWERIGDDPMFRLPERVYELRGKMVFLKLYCCNVTFSRLRSLQFLRTLSLGYTRITSKQLRSLLESCPILDTLGLERCWGMKSLRIMVPDEKHSNLKNFVMNGCLNKNVVEVEGHSLRYFEYSGQVVEFLMGNQGELVELRLDFSTQKKYVRSSSGHFCFLLGDLLTVKFMTVCSVFLQIIAPAYLHPDTDFDFDTNVEHLTLNTACHANEFIGIKFMIASCPKMHTLTLRIVPGKIFEDYEAPFAIEPETIWIGMGMTQALTRSLQVLNVRGFEGLPNQMSLIRYIMHRGRCLRSVNVCLAQVQENSNEYGEAVRQASLLMQSPKANPDLEILVVKQVL